MGFLYFSTLLAEVAQGLVFAGVRSADELAAGIRAAANVAALRRVVEDLAVGGAGGNGDGENDDGDETFHVLLPHSGWNTITTGRVYC